MAIVLTDAIEKASRVYRYPDKFTKEFELYKLHRAIECGDHQGGGLILTLDFFGVPPLYESGDHNAVALMGSTISDEQGSVLEALETPTSKGTVSFNPRVCVTILERSQSLDPNQLAKPVSSSFSWEFSSSRLV